MESKEPKVKLLWKKKIDDVIDSIDISADGEYVVVGCPGGNVYFL